jgi:L-lactate dehydrogenase
MPAGLVLDHDGRPTTDPARALEGGSLAPLGGPHAPHKGFGLALVVDALAGVLSGAGFARGVAGGATGSFLWALDVEAFLPRDEFLARMDAQIDQIGDSEPRAEAGELPVPGERGERRRLELVARGAVPLGEASWRLLAAGCASLGVAAPPVLDG